MLVPAAAPGGALPGGDAASDWLEGYRAINAKYGQYGHCQIYQESALLINTAKFATSVDDGFCKQVMSGADTDCYGEIIGSILGAYYGSGHM
jgi:ADP-ribosylglycohydrolase